MACVGCRGVHAAAYISSVGFLGGVVFKGGGVHAGVGYDVACELAASNGWSGVTHLERVWLLGLGGAYAALVGWGGGVCAGERIRLSRGSVAFNG